ncbi:MAG: GNAT family N-acetyltransferase, partial [Gemmatimonadetes bacterium]|nr:GNAT family N-acetyltransferase [Gemmatimonadota bacterium]NIS00374.1 GNAT family N-acetyltransferase [Gemmatimonadota bacterium]NIT66033.1 GNAT family N-acetyltransferase [Gemmatimonadota bacterium]NIV22614.1 hypothetical protein [Gemmatimonadota bacterium]NIW37698.1 hypothetical protein [Gemmatimonadota bacterium]
FRHHNNWVKLYGQPQLESLPPFPDPLRVNRIHEDQAATFGGIVATAFAWPPDLADWVAATVGRPGWCHYLAFDADGPIATGAVYARDGTAWLDFAATLPAHRGRGAQTVLLAHRIREAAGQGARWLSAEAAEDRPDHPSPSLHNMLRLGLHEAYRRPNYVRYRALDSAGDRG